MKMSFGVQTPNLTNDRKNAKKVAEEVLFRSMVKMEELAKQKAPVDTGNLKNRIHLTPTTMGAKTYVLSDGVNYGVFVEYGTKPHFVPITPLLGWAGRKLGDKKSAFSVRNAIAKYGTPAQPFFRPAYDEVRNIWLKRIEKEVMARNFG